MTFEKNPNNVIKLLIAYLGARAALNNAELRQT